MLSSNSTTVKKKSETCKDQLRRMCKSIANGITDPEEITDEETGEKRTETASDWMEGTYDIRYIVDREALLQRRDDGSRWWPNYMGKPEYDGGRRILGQRPRYSALHRQLRFRWLLRRDVWLLIESTTAL